MPKRVYRCQICQTEYVRLRDARACEGRGNDFRFKINARVRTSFCGHKTRVIITQRWIEGPTHHRTYYFQVCHSLINRPEFIGSVGKAYEDSLQAL